MELKINKDWVIQSGETTFWLKNKENVIGEYSSFFSALDAYPNHRVKHSKNTSMGKMVRLIQEIRDEMDMMKDQLDELSREAFENKE